MAANHNSLAPNSKIGATACPKSDGPDGSGAVIGGEWVEFMSAAELFKCPNCGSQYKLVRVEAEPDPSHGRIECRHCGGPLNGREGRFILKYFLRSAAAATHQIGRSAASACRFISP